MPKFVDFVDGVTHTRKKTKSNDIVSALPTAHHKTSQHVPWCPNTDSNENVFSFLRNESVDRGSFRSVVSLFLWCGNRESSVVDSSICPRYDEVVTRQGAQCRSCGYFDDRCQQVRDVPRRVSKKRLVSNRIRHQCFIEGQLVQLVHRPCSQCSYGAQQTM